jgi:hypothetical protein
MVVTVRIVTTTYRYKRPPKKRKAVALEVPVIVAAKKNRRPELRRAAAEVGLLNCPAIHDGAAQPSTPRDAERDRAVTSPPANDDRKSAIVTTTSRKRLKLQRAEERSAERDDDPEAMARVRAFFARNVRPGGPLPPKRR